MQDITSAFRLIRRLFCWFKNNELYQLKVDVGMWRFIELTFQALAICESKKDTLCSDEGLTLETSAHVFTVFNIPTSTFSWYSSFMFYLLCWCRSTLVLTAGTCIPLLCSLLCCVVFIYSVSNCIVCCFAICVGLLCWLMVLVIVLCVVLVYCVVCCVAYCFCFCYCFCAVHS